LKNCTRHPGSSAILQKQSMMQGMLESKEANMLLVSQQNQLTDRQQRR
jgi:hypothetical protein